MKRLHGIYIIFFGVPLTILFGLFLKFLNIKGWFVDILAGFINILLMLIVLFGFCIILGGKPISNDIKNLKVKLALAIAGNLGLRIIGIFLGGLFVLAGYDFFANGIDPSNSSIGIFYRFRIGWFPIGNYNSHQLLNLLLSLALIFIGATICLYCIGLIKYKK